MPAADATACDAGVEVDMMVERRTEAVEKGDAAEPRAGVATSLVTPAAAESGPIVTEPAAPPP
jgi:hypothetical protein